MGPPRYFGTDGVRDIAGEGLLAAPAVRRWGRAIALWTRREGLSGPVLLGRDTRESGPGIGRAIARELAAEGLLVRDAGVVPTAAVSFLARDLPASLGVVVSASHNPAEYNGVKLLDGSGRKLAPEREAAIEEIWEGLDARHESGATGPASRIEGLDWQDRYVAALKRHFPGLDLAGREVLLDCASGAAYRAAPAAFAAFGARVARIDPEPDGRNINEGSGALHPDRLVAAHAERRPWLSFAFDGDADRVLPVDEEGRLRDGDDILAFTAAARRASDPRAPIAVVATVLSNVGLDLFLAPLSVRVVRCDVGDRHVTEAVFREKALLGAEPSGHVVIPAWGPTGDGIVTALHLASLLAGSRGGFAASLRGFARAASVTRNVKVARRPALETLPRVAAAVAEGTGALAGTGRLLLRYSGTEPLARVLVEGRDPAACERIAESLAEAIRREIGA